MPLDERLLLVCSPHFIEALGSMIHRSSTRLAKPRRLPRLYVGIGAVADRLPSLCMLLQAVPPDAGLTVVVILPGDTDADALEQLVAQTQCALPLEVVRETTRLKRNRVYLACLQASLRMNGGVLDVESLHAATVPAPIDHFFSSLAEDQHEYAVGIVLAGGNSDGLLGLKAINDAGGMTILETAEPGRTSLHSSANAHSNGIDHTLPTADIAIELGRYALHLQDIASTDAESVRNKQIIEAIPAIAEAVQRHTEHNFKHYKVTTLARRIRRRMQVLKTASVEAYVDVLRASRDESQRLFRDLLISVTSFFRDHDAFETLATTVIPKLLRNHDDTQPLRIWVPGCATGEEAYTLAIIFREAIQKTGRSIDLQIFGTDLDERALHIARQGSYPVGIADDVTSERLKRYFIKRGMRYIVGKQLRDCVIFSTHNLISDPPFTKLDLISCRNLLIYLGSHLQKKLVPLFHYALRPGGYLFLGPSESFASHKELFRTVNAKYRIMQRKGTSIGLPAQQGTHGPATTRPAVDTENADQMRVDLHQFGQRIALDEFAAQWAIVDEEAHILSLSGDTSPFLKLAEGSFQNNIIKMAHASLRVGLRAAFSEAKRKQRQIVHDHLSLRVQGGIQRVVLTVQPMPQVGQDSGLYFIAFQMVGKPLPRHSDESSDGSVSRPDTEANDLIIEQLERELATTREDLERTVQELEAANEELKSSNEELLSINEELHSANEELETSKEAVQASNEALARINSDLENLLRSTDIATIFLDRDNHIRGFTPAIAAIYGLIASDVGRPLSQLSPLVREMPPLPTLAMLESARHAIEDTIQTLDGRWYIRRVLPYHSSDGACDGSVITFADVTELRESERRLETALRGGSLSAWEIDLRTGEYWRTPGHDRLFGHEEDLPHWNYELFLKHVVREQVEQVERQFAQCLQSLDDWSLECEIIRADGERRWIYARGQPVGDHQGKPVRMFGTIGDITERKNFERALAESETHLRRIIDNMLGFVGVLDTRGVLLDANEAALNGGGVTGEELFGKYFWDCYWWTHDAFEVNRLQAAVEKASRGEIVRYDARLRTAGDRMIDIDFMLAPAYNTAGEVTHLIPSAVDITERKAAEEALRDSEAFNRSILESSGDCIKVVDLDGRLVSINPSGLDVLEMSDAACVLGTHWLDMWPAESRQVAEQAYQSALQGGVGRFVGQCCTRKGTLKWWDVLVTPIMNSNGQPERLLSISRDISDTRSMQLAMQESELRFQTLADNMAQFAWMADSNGTLFWYNQRWFDYTGTTLEEMQSHGWKAVHHPDHIERVTAKFNHAIENGLEWEDTFPLRGKDGTYRWFLSRAMPIRDPEGNVVRWFGTDTDISDRIRIEAELEEARRQAEAANQAKSDFLANMSHEIRTPMTAILGFADLLQAIDDEEREKVETIRRNGQFLLELINDILDLSKIEAGKVEIDLLRFSPSKLVEDVCSLMHVRAVESNLELKLEFEGLIPDVIENDPIRVRQILINLVGNAIKFTHEGVIRLRLSFSSEDQMLRFSVIDTGIGIPPKLQAKLFRPFEQGDTSIVRRYGGSGLGLAISQRLAHVLGGKIEVCSEPGQGSTFTLSISIGSVKDMQLIHYNPLNERWLTQHQPHTLADSEQRLMETVERVGSGQLNVRVLVVDDRRDIRFLTQHFVRQAGGEVLLAENGKQALAIASDEQRAGRPLHIILMDVQMPEMDGITATRHLRSAEYTGPIIALTANAMDTDRQTCLEAGYTDYLSKPIDATQLIDMLRRYSKGTDSPYVDQNSCQGSDD